MLDRIYRISQDIPDILYIMKILSILSDFLRNLFALFA